MKICPQCQTEMIQIIGEGWKCKSCSAELASQSQDVESPHELAKTSLIFGCLSALIVPVILGSLLNSPIAMYISMVSFGIVAIVTGVKALSRIKKLLEKKVATMNSRIRYWAIVVFLPIVGVIVIIGSSNSQRTAYASPSLNKESYLHITISGAINTTPEPRAFLPVVMQDFCPPVSIPDDANLSGVVFFDYNGDGSQQSREPGIVGASVSIGSKSTLSQCDGVYYFRNLPDGIYNLVVTAPGFRYLSISRSDFKPAGTPVRTAVSGKTKRNVGLMQGFLTIPFHRNANPYVGEYFDYDPTYYKYLWWNGQAGDGPFWRNHVGTDFMVSENGTPVVASSPGRVTNISEDLYSGYCVGVRAPDGTHWGVCHITPTVSIGQILSRGDLMGQVNFPSAPHVHLDMSRQRADGWYFFDTFVPLDPSICAEWKWAPNNDPIYVKANCSPGYWSVTNNPQPFD